jgi:isopentenyl diphosphate isomerase/L-lactate dehydrogenase-like FMN-dependent dehydrogenase
MRWRRTARKRHCQGGITWSARLHGGPRLPVRLGAAGERGVDHVLDLFAQDVRRTIALVGAASTADLGQRLIRFRVDDAHVS